MSTPDISVVMSVYNGQSTLQRSLDSILGQEGVDLELIVVNDGSTDNSAAILDAAAETEHRLQVIHQENRGLTQALIRGCVAARGRYVARQDADDVSHPGRLARQKAVLDSTPDVAMVSCSVQWIGPDGEKLHVVAGEEEPRDATHQLLEGCVGPPAHGTVMFRTDVYQRVGGYREEFYFSQDTDLWLRMGECGMLAYVPGVLLETLFDPNAISAAHRPRQRRFGELSRACYEARRQGRSEESVLQTVRELREETLHSNGATGHDRKRRSAALYFIASSLERRGDGRAESYFRRALAANPLHLRAGLRLMRSMVMRSFRSPTV